MKNHRNLQDPPTDPAEQRALIRWLKEHPVWTYPYEVRVPPDGEFRTEPHPTLPNHSILVEPDPSWPLEDIGMGSFEDCVDTLPVFICPNKECVTGDPEQDTQFWVWLEGGPWWDSSGDFPEPEDGWTSHNRWVKSHDVDLDVGAADLKRALLLLAMRVKCFYGEGRVRIVPDQCQGIFDNDRDSWTSGCTIAPDGYCTSCGFAPHKDDNENS